MAAEKSIPEHSKGIKTNTESSVNFDDLISAKDGFMEAKKRLMNISCWHDLAGESSAVFELANSEGKVIDREPELGDYFKIKIPAAPKASTGEGFDWVKIELIESDKDESLDTESFTIRVRPASNPENQDTDTAHFFSEEATSTFMVKRNGNTITAGIYGRNEKPNLEAESLLDKARNALVAFAAAIGLAKFQWQKLLDGIVGEAKELDNYELGDK